MYNIKRIYLKHDLWYEGSGFVSEIKVGEMLNDTEIVSIELNSYNNLTDFGVKFSDDTTIIIPYHNVSGYELGGLE